MTADKAGLIGNVELLETITTHPQIFQGGRKSDGQIASKFYGWVSGGSCPQFSIIICLLTLYRGGIDKRVPG